MTDDLETLRHDNEPLRRALAMARALAQFLDELHDDDPDDDPRTLRRIEHAALKADDLACALSRVTEENTRG